MDAIANSEKTVWKLLKKTKKKIQILRIMKGQTKKLKIPHGNLQPKKKSI